MPKRSGRQTIDDIAQLAGVSKSTVSRALSDSPLISAETRERIQALARQYNYQVNLPARRLSMQQSNTIAFVTHNYCATSSAEDIFTFEILDAISLALAKNTYDLLMVHVDPNDTEWPRLYLNSGRADGFILMVSSRKESHIQTLLDVEAPFIAWEETAGETNHCTVSGDNLTGGRLATQHLLDGGRRRIAFLGGPRGEMEVQLRYAGYEAALKAAGMTVDPELCCYGDFTSASGTAAMQEILARDVDVDGVFVNSDLMAIAAIRTLIKSGRRVPEDVAVIGYDDVSMARYCIPSLTTIRQNIPEIGRSLVQGLIHYLQTGEITQVTVPVELVIRESCC